MYLIKFFLILFAINYPFFPKKSILLVGKRKLFHIQVILPVFGSVKSGKAARGITYKTTDMPRLLKNAAQLKPPREDE